jgi:predicted ArsR family transcriptional regulator
MNELTCGNEASELVTVAQLAAAEGITVDGMRKKLVKLGMEPVVPTVRNHEGTTPEQYSLHKYNSICAKTVSSPAIRAEVVRQELDALDADQTMQLAIEAGQVALQKMRERQARQAEESLEKVEALQLQLDESNSWCTLKKFNAIHNLGFTGQELGKISKKMGMLGYQRVKVMGDANYEKGLWSYKVSDCVDYFKLKGDDE